MAFVMDASVTACWAFDDEVHPTATRALSLLRSGQGAVVPGLWWFEVRNTLIINERRGRISDVDTGVFLRLLSELDVTMDQSPEGSQVLTLARAHRLTIYDAAYLELAQRYELPLATLDRHLRQAAEQAGVALLG
jgi:predicted nucleic acid-binding protein